jgi:hypothetical protein
MRMGAADSEVAEASVGWRTRRWPAIWVASGEHVMAGPRDH